MAAGPGDDKPSDEERLELPSLRLSIRRKKKPSPTEPGVGSETKPVLEARPEEEVEPAGETGPEAGPEAEPDAGPETEPEAGPEAHAGVEEPAPARGPLRRLALPKVTARVAAAMAGIVVGLISVGLESGTQRGCQAVRGVGNCGGFGLFGLVIILIISVLVGGVILRALGVRDPVSTSFLGVGLVAVIVILFLLGAIESAWMILVIPLLGGATFVLSNWIGEIFVESPNDSPR